MSVLAESPGEREIEYRYRKIDAHNVVGPRPRSSESIPQGHVAGDDQHYSAEADGSERPAKILGACKNLVETFPHDRLFPKAGHVISRQVCYSRRTPRPRLFVSFSTSIQF